MEKDHPTKREFLHRLPQAHVDYFYSLNASFNGSGKSRIQKLIHDSRVGLPLPIIHRQLASERLILDSPETVVPTQEVLEIERGTYRRTAYTVCSTEYGLVGKIILRERNDDPQKYLNECIALIATQQLEKEEATYPLYPPNAQDANIT